MNVTSSTGADRDGPPLVVCLRFLRDHARHVMVARGWPRNSCVGTARVVVDVLAAAGHRAEPLSVTLDVNPARGVPQRLVRPGAGGLLNTGDWAGHLIVMCDGFLVDLSADQVVADGVRLPPVVAQLPSPDVDAWQVELGGHLLVYEALRTDRSFLDTVDWQCRERGEVTRVRDLLVADLKAVGTADPRVSRGTRSSGFGR